MIEALARLAEDPDYHVQPAEGSRRIAGDRFCVTIASDLRWAGVCRLRLPEQKGAFTAALDEIGTLVAGAKSVMWNVGSSALPPRLPERLRAAGLRDPDPPFDPVAAAMIRTTEPPAVAGVEIRRVETFEEHLAGLEIVLSGNWTEESADDERRLARRTFERRRRRGVSAWLALLDGAPVAHALAEPSRAGLFLAGGATLPEARGGGATARSSARAGTRRCGSASRPRGPGAVRLVRADPPAARLPRDERRPHVKSPREAS